MAVRKIARSQAIQFIFLSYKRYGMSPLGVLWIDYSSYTINSLVILTTPFTN
ncbi:hypothetical protein HCUR_01038 [Holospora curviuscula]|uniref:Uncharacterized protein n=1 Tax=Holospora curviuscula TaxID=1082868 RepID=A0A2S5R856_9PROT|nr:hypothetical protein HCUR_01038 [Holospora curviuscula]